LALCVLVSLVCADRCVLFALFIIFYLLKAQVTDANSCASVELSALCLRQSCAKREGFKLNVLDYKQKIGVQNNLIIFE